MAKLLHDNVGKECCCEGVGECPGDCLGCAVTIGLQVTDLDVTSVAGQCLQWPTTFDGVAIQLVNPNCSWFAIPPFSFVDPGGGGCGTFITGAFDSYIRLRCVPGFPDPPDFWEIEARLSTVYVPGLLLGHVWHFYRREVAAGEDCPPVGLPFAFDHFGVPAQQGVQVLNTGVAFVT